MIPEIDTILYASDLGESSRSAFLMAAKEAYRHNARLVFLNIVEPANSTTETMLDGFMEEGAVEQMRAQGIEKIKYLMQSRLDAFNQKDLKDKIPLQHEPITRVEEGPAAETIIKVADEIKADMIIMGTRTRTHSALGRFFVGSTAQSVMQLTNRPVLIVPLPED